MRMILALSYKMHTWEFCLDYANVMHVVILQLVQYLRICCNYQNFAYRSKLLTTRLLRQGYAYQKLCITFVHRYPKTLQKYGRCLKNIITECIALPSNGAFEESLPTFELENVEHCGGEPEQAANGFDVGFVTSK